MGFLWRGKSSVSPIGIDFGTHGLKALQVTTDESPRIVAAAYVRLPDEARKDPEVYSSFVSQSLRELVNGCKFEGKRAVASISSAHTYIQHLRLHRSEGEAFTQQIETELRGRLPLDPSQMVIRHVNVGEFFLDGANRQEVICLAASRTSIMRTVQTVRSAGLEMVGMHGEPMAILESFAHLFRRTSDTQRTTMFVDIGAVTTKALIAHGRDLVFAKTIHVAGDHFNRQLAAHMGVSAAEALHARLKKSGTLEPQGPAPGVRNSNDQGLPMIDSLVRDEPTGSKSSAGGASQAEPHPVATAVENGPQRRSIFQDPEHGEMLEALSDELHLCIGYHDSMFHDRRLDKVVFLGGESRHTKLCQSVARALRLPAQLGDPLARLGRPASSESVSGIELGEAQPGWAVPMGLCLLPTNL